MPRFFYSEFMTPKIYEYSGCSTCKNALKFLDARKVKYEKIPIVDKPPSVAELREMLAYLKAGGGSFKNLFNTSGQMYRELKIGDRIKAGMTEAEAVTLLSKHGKLVKRPFFLTGKTGVVGFKEVVWKKLFS